MSPGEFKKRHKTHHKFGHNLCALLEEAQNRALDKKVQLDQQEIDAIKQLKHDYVEQRFEYRVTGRTY